LISALEMRLSGAIADLTTHTLKPWWFGFKGPVNAGADDKTWITKGLYEFVDDDAAIIRIKELPVGCWTKDYKNFLDQMLVEQEELKSASKKDGSKPMVWLRGYEEAYNDIDCDFILQMDPEYYHEARAYTADFEARFKLTTQHKTTNMVAFDVDGTIRRFASPGEILERFYGERLCAYGKRKAHELGRLESEITELSARLLFIKSVISGKLVISNVDDAVLYAAMKALGLPQISDPAAKDLKAYEYLLRLRVDRLKATAVAELEREVAEQQEKHKALTATTQEMLWLSDLRAFRVVYGDYCTARVDSYASAATDKPAEKKRRPVVPRKKA
jgi:DNA topoisomerase-2